MEKLQNERLDVYSLTFEGSLAAVLLEPKIDFSKYREENFFFEFAQFLIDKGIGFPVVRAWIIEGLRSAISQRSLTLDVVHRPRNFETICSELSSREKFGLLLEGLSEGRDQLRTILSSEEASKYRARLPDIMKGFYIISGVPELRCAQCGVRIPLAGHEIRMGKYCSLDCFRAISNLLPTGNRVKCSYKDCKNLVYVAPGALKRKPQSLHFCKTHAHSHQNRIWVECACGCQTKFQVWPRDKKELNFFKDDYYSYLKTHPTAAQSPETLKKARDAYRKVWEANRIQVKCEKCGKLFPLSPSKAKRSKRHFCKDCWTPSLGAAGLKQSEELKEKRRAIMIDYDKRHPERRKKISRSKGGKKLSNEARRNMSKSHKRLFGRTPFPRDRKSGRFVKRKSA